MCTIHIFFVFFFFKQETAYEMRISDWSSDVCSSDLDGQPLSDRHPGRRHRGLDGGGGAGAAVACRRLRHRADRIRRDRQDRKGVVQGKSVSVRVELGGRRNIKKKRQWMYEVSSSITDDTTIV